MAHPGPVLVQVVLVVLVVLLLATTRLAGLRSPPCHC
jgi:hypothetical protein